MIFESQRRSVFLKMHYYKKKKNFSCKEIRNLKFLTTCGGGSCTSGVSLGSDQVWGGRGMSCI